MFLLAGDHPSRLFSGEDSNQFVHSHVCNKSSNQAGACRMPAGYWNDMAGLYFSLIFKFPPHEHEHEHDTEAETNYTAKFQKEL